MLGNITKDFIENGKAGIAGAVGYAAMKELNNIVRDNVGATVTTLQGRTARAVTLILLQSVISAMIPERVGMFHKLRTELMAGAGVVPAQLLASDNGITFFEAANFANLDGVADTVNNPQVVKGLLHEIRVMCGSLGINPNGASDAQILQMLNQINKLPGGVKAVLTGLEAAKQNA